MLMTTIIASAFADESKGAGSYLRPEQTQPPPSSTVCEQAGGETQQKGGSAEFNPAAGRCCWGGGGAVTELSVGFASLGLREITADAFSALTPVCSFTLLWSIVGMTQSSSQRAQTGDTHRGRPVAIQNRSMMSLELQYLLKTTCKTQK